MSEYKGRKLRDLDAPEATPTPLRANSLMRWSPFRAVLEQQDHVPATSRRKLAACGMNGSDTWECPDGTDDPGTAGSPVGARVYPDTTTWRTRGTYHARLTPGCMLEADVVFCGAGLTQIQQGANFYSGGAWGEVRIGATWTSGLNTTGPHYFSMLMPGSDTGDWGGAEEGEGWATLQEKTIAKIQPPDISDPAIAARYSEDTSVAFTIEVRGAPRIVECSVWEQPATYVKTDNAEDVSVHCMPGGLNQLTPRPQEKPNEGGGDEEHRFGTTHMMVIASRQGELLGPRVWECSAYSESAQEWDQTEPTPFTITSVTFDDIFDSTNSTYDESNPGFVVAASHAQLHRLCEENLIGRGEFAAIPVRVYVDAEMTGGTGTVRVQSSPYEWVDVTIAAGARADFTAAGYLCSQVYPDHAAANGQVFARVTAGTLEIHNISIDFGHPV